MFVMFKMCTLLIEIKEQKTGIICVNIFTYSTFIALHRHFRVLRHHEESHVHLKSAQRSDTERNILVPNQSEQQKAEQSQ